MLTRLFTRPPSDRPGDSRRDEGAILVLGVPACIMMVGVLWYISGIGDAIVYRERMQEAADATVYAAAAMQARGMNLVVLVNLLMAAILGILVCINLVAFLAYLFGAICLALCWIPGLEWMSAAGSFCMEVGSNAEELANDIRPEIDDALVGLNKSWGAVRDGTPEVAEAAAVEMETKYSAFASLASIPAVGNSVPVGKLPIVSDDLDKLCQEAGKAAGTVFADIFTGGNAKAVNLIGGMFGGLAASDPEMFCNLPGVPGQATLPDLCTTAQQNAGGTLANDAGDDASAQIENACNSGAGSGSDMSDDPSKMAPAGIDPTWEDGCDDAQILSIIEASSGAKRLAGYDSTAMTAGATGQVKIPPPNEASGQIGAFAQAELFYDQDVWLPNDAMWNFFWRSRFRLTNPHATTGVAGDIGLIIKGFAMAYGSNIEKANDATLSKAPNEYSKNARTDLDQAITATKDSPVLH